MDLPQIDRFLFRLRFTRPARLPFFHGGVLRGLISRALGQHELPPGLIPVVCEMGRVTFQPGDAYHLGVVLAEAVEGPASGEPTAELAARLAAGLARVGAQGGRLGHGPLPRLGGNFVLEEVVELPAPDLAAEIDSARQALAEVGEVTLRFVSPLRLERPRELKAKGAGFFDSDCFPAAPFLDRLARRVYLLGHGDYPSPEQRDAIIPELPAGSEATPGPLTWLDVPVPGARQKNRPYTLGGVLGRVTLRGLTEDWLPILVAGQHVHAGSKTGFALGRYLLGEATQSETDPFRPARSLLEAMARPRVLSEAFDHVLSDSEAAGLDGVSPEAFDHSRHENLRRLSGELLAGRYRPPALFGLAVPKADGGLRPLAIPTVRDRAAQRAAASVLAPAIDTLLEDASFAYRKGLSRAGAAQAIQRAYEEGYRYVLDADIHAFFDCVDWGLLFAKLDALYPGEPLVSLLQEWVRAPVVFDGRTLERQRGLPQGSAVSPLLANLYLDTFDEELLDDGFRLVRYADDFVILTRDLDRARQAQDAAREALGDLHLQLNEDETAIRSLNDGFTYLGYLFCRSLALEHEGDEPEARPTLIREEIPSASWLAQVPFDRLRELVRGRASGARRRGGDVEIVPLIGESGRPLPPTRPLYLTDPQARLHLAGGTLRIERPGSEDVELPLRSLSHVVLLGRTRATVPLLRSLARFSVPVYFCRANGELTATFAPHEAEWSLWLRQAERAADDAFRSAVAREIVAAKLHNTAVLAVRYDWHTTSLDTSELAAELRRLRDEAANKTALDALRGLEGRGAALLFAALAACLPTEWGFAGRVKRPPRDPVNAMLSFGYTLLHHHAATALTLRGLNPQVGFFHASHGRHQALASDLQEEMRWLVDALIWSLIRRREVRPEDFTASPDGRYPCLLTREARQRFVAAFEERLFTLFTPPHVEKLGAEEPMSYREFLSLQAWQLRGLVLDDGATYRPLRLHA